MKTFKEWLLNEDIFGFEKKRSNLKDDAKDDGPILAINAEVIIETMFGTDLSGQPAFSDSPDQIQWGRTPGAIQMVISPLGSFKSIVRRLQIDLNGKEVWACKKIVPYKNILHTTKQIDENIAFDLFDMIKEIHQEPIEAPSGEYRGLEKLVIKLTKKLTQKDVIPELLIFRGIKEIKKHENYLIFFECRGQGVETPGSGRLEQFIINMSYSPKTGMIRSFGHDVQSPAKGHVWYPQPSEWDECFSPSQNEKEIFDAICAAFGTY